MGSGSQIGIVSHELIPAGYIYCLDRQPPVQMMPKVQEGYENYPSMTGVPDDVELPKPVFPKNPDIDYGDAIVGSFFDGFRNVVNNLVDTGKSVFNYAVEKPGNTALIAGGAVAGAVLAGVLLPASALAVLGTLAVGSTVGYLAYKGKQALEGGVKGTVELVFGNEANARNHFKTAGSSGTKFLIAGSSAKITAMATAGKASQQDISVFHPSILDKSTQATFKSLPIKRFVQTLSPQDSIMYGYKPS